RTVTGVQTCALPISRTERRRRKPDARRRLKRGRIEAPCPGRALRAAGSVRLDTACRRWLQRYDGCCVGATPLARGTACGCRYRAVRAVGLQTGRRRAVLREEQ